MEFGLFFGYLILCFIIASIAGGKGRSSFGWFLFSAFFSPIIAGFCLLIAGKKEVSPDPSTHIKCPDCKELILKEARVCRHCGCKLIPQS